MLKKSKNSFQIFNSKTQKKNLFKYKILLKNVNPKKVKFT